MSVKELKSKIEAIVGSEFTVTTQLPIEQEAWLAIPVFAVAKKNDKKPNDVAQELIEKLVQLPDITVEINNGYVNITPKQQLVIACLKQALDSNYGSSDIGKKQKVIIEFSGTNIAKPMSIGHLRSTIIGDSLQRIYRKLGYDVISVNHLGDWGTQFGKLLVAYKQQYGDLEPRNDLTVRDLLDLYVKYHIESDRDPELDTQARAMFKRLEDKDSVARKLWQSFIKISLQEFEAIFKRLDIKMDKPTMGESSYEEMLPGIINLAVKKGVAEESDGALIIRIPNEATPLILRKKDGATVYATRDLAQVKYRVDNYRPNKILYVVANEQALHFRQYFQAVHILGIAPMDVELVHVKFGLVRLPQGKMSTRRGSVIFLDDVLNQAVEKARTIAKQKNPQLKAIDLERIAEVVGIGAIKYFDLSHDRNHDIIFDWDRMLSLAGNSAPYLQYSYTRARSILLKAEKDQENLIKILDSEQNDLNQDFNQIIKQIARFSLVIEEAAHGNYPHLIANHLNKLATAFNHFYEKYPVIKANHTEQPLRLAIVAATATIIKIGLDLLGIKTLEKM